MADDLARTVEWLRAATRVNMPVREGMRIVGFELPEEIAWPKDGGAIDILQVLLDHASPAAIEALQRDREMLIAFAAYVAQRDDSLGDDARAVLSHLKENDR